MFMIKSLSNNYISFLTIILAGVLSFVTGRDFYEMREIETFYPSSSLQKTINLSDINPSLKNTSGDSKIYCVMGEKEGGKTLILGGTHPNEPAGFMAAYLLLENIQVEQGTVYILPQANLSAFSHNDPQEGMPQYVTIDGKKGKRRFCVGSRITNPIDQWPDPEIYLHYPSGQKLAGNETRNLNRSYPGKEHGSLTEEVAFSIIKFIQDEKIDLSFDLHEAAPEYPVVNAIVATQRSEDIASEAAIELELDGLNYSLEPSPYNFRGLSHREWQDFTETYPILLETANPIQGRLRGKTDERLIHTGLDKMYLKAEKLGVLHVPYDSTGIPLRLRIGRHIAAVTKIIEVFSRNHPAKQIIISGIPDYGELMEAGLEKYF
jgi:hypothetical protein